MNLQSKNAHSRDDFNCILQNNHFDVDPDDKFWKVHLLFDELNIKAKSCE